jgi:YVTN family beta-propeller protein
VAYGARGLALNPDGTLLYVSCACGDVFAIDTRTLTIANSTLIPVGGCDKLFGIGVAKDESRVLVADEKNDLYFLNPTTLDIEATIPYDWGKGAMELVISPDGVHAYGLNPGGSSGNIYVIDIASAQQVKKVPVVGNAFYMAMNPDGTIGYLTIRNNGGGIEKKIRIYSLPECDEIATINTVYDVNEIEERDGILYVASPRAERLTFVDLEHQSEWSVPTLAPCWHMDLSPDGSLVAVTNRYTNSVSILDAATGEILESPPTGNSPTRVLFSNDSRRLYVASGSDGIVTVLERLPIQVHFDVKPLSCPNPFNVGAQGVLPAAILGTESFDVSDIDLTTILLEGVGPLRADIEDVAQPVIGEDVCDCETEWNGPDGLYDLTLKFDVQDVAQALGAVQDGDVVVLTITGKLSDGRDFQGQDCVVIKDKGGGQVADLISVSPKVLALDQNTPNPFARETSISFNLPHAGHATLSVYDARGAMVDAVVDQELAAGMHVVSWGRQNLESGVYFYRLTCNGQTVTRKMTIVR